MRICKTFCVRMQNEISDKQKKQKSILKQNGRIKPSTDD